MPRDRIRVRYQKARAATRDSPDFEETLESEADATRRFPTTIAT